jgi:hypothetical protein
MTLQQLDAVTLGRDMPEISDSLQVLQDISLSRKPPQQITESKAEVAPTPAEKDMQDPVASDIPAGNTR